MRWLWNPFELLSQRLLAGMPEDGWQQADTTALPVKHPSRVRGPGGWDGPGGPRPGRAAGPADLVHRLQLANALFEYLEIFHNRTRRHSALGMLTPIEF